MIEIFTDGALLPTSPPTLSDVNIFNSYSQRILGYITQAHFLKLELKAPLN